MVNIKVDSGAKLHLLSEKGKKNGSIKAGYVQVVPHGNNVFCAATDTRACAVVEMRGQADEIYGLDGTAFNVRREEKNVHIEGDTSSGVFRTCKVKNEEKSLYVATNIPHGVENVLTSIEDGSYCLVNIDAAILLDTVKAMGAADSEGNCVVTLIIRTNEKPLSSREIGEILDEARPDRDELAKMCEQLEFDEFCDFCSIKEKGCGRIISLVLECGSSKLIVSYSNHRDCVACASGFTPDKPRGPYDVADALLSNYDDRKVAKMAEAVETDKPIAIVSTSSNRMAIGCIAHASMYSENKAKAIEKYNTIRSQFVEAAAYHTK